MPLQTRELLMHMLLWQKKVLPVQGAVGRGETVLPRPESTQVTRSRGLILHSLSWGRCIAAGAFAFPGVPSVLCTQGDRGQ